MRSGGRPSPGPSRSCRPGRRRTGRSSTDRPGRPPSPSRPRAAPASTPPPGEARCSRAASMSLTHSCMPLADPGSPGCSPRPKRHRARRAGRGRLHDAHAAPGVVHVEREAEPVDVELLGPVDVADRDQHDLERPVHRVLLLCVVTADTVRRGSSSRAPARKQTAPSSGAAVGQGHREQRARARDRPRADRGEAEEDRSEHVERRDRPGPVADVVVAPCGVPRGRARSRSDTRNRTEPMASGRHTCCPVAAPAPAASERRHAASSR